MSPAERDPDDTTLTLRFSRRVIAAVVAVLAHVVVIAAVRQLPEPQPKPKRIEVTLQAPPPPPPEATSPEPPPKKAPPPPSTTKPQKTTTPPPPSTSPVVPELPPSESPPENRAQLPVAERSLEPAPPPTGSWRDRLRDSLKAPSAPSAPQGPLAPSFRTLDKVAMSDAKLFDEQTEKRIAANFGPFFRRGIEALRGNWHPERVLRTLGDDPTALCGRERRETFAVAVLDKQGSVVDVEIKNPSGCPQLDVEAVAAFKRAAKFPFPPAGLFFAPDGTPTETTRYPVRFIVTFDGGFSLDWR